MAAIKVTIAIPTYNRSGYLAQAIESALGQDYPNIEIIISDNASTDGTDELIKRYLPDKRFIYHRQKTNLGSQKNWEKLLYEYADGEWVMMLGSDDYLLDTQYISKCILSIQKTPDSVMCFGKMRILREAKGDFYDQEFTAPAVINGEYYFWDYEQGSKIHIASLLFCRKRAIAAEVFTFDAIGGELELLGKLLLMGKVCFIDSVVVAYRVHSSGDSYKADFEWLYRHYQIYLKILDFAAELHPEWDKKLDRMIKNRMQGFFKTTFYNYLTKNKVDAFRFLFRSLKDYPRQIIPLLAQRKVLFAVILGILFSEKSFKKIRDSYYSKYYGRTAEPYA